MNQISVATYQSEARKTRSQKQGDDATIISLLGIAGEAGELLSEYKKHVRDRDSHKLFAEKLKEELGDILWYLSDTASNFGISLEEVAVENLKKCNDRWMCRAEIVEEGLLFVDSFDADYPDEERIPRRMEVEISDVDPEQQKVVLKVDGRPLGDTLTDNSYSEDGYRFHDVFHFACLGVLGWSPIMRGLMGRKRKSNPTTDEVEDGGRAQVIEEGIAAMVYSYAREHNWLEGTDIIEYEVLRTIKGMVQHLEVSIHSEGQWETAIIRAYEVWRYAVKHKSVQFVADLDAKTLEIVAPRH